jgi:hypothetical protein
LGNASFAGMENPEIRKRSLPVAESTTVIFPAEKYFFTEII